MAGLQFSDTTNKLGLIQECEFLLNMGDAAISGDASSQALLKVFTRLLNGNLQKIVTAIFESQDEWDWDDINQTDYPIATTSLVANQQDYSLPANILKIDRLEVSYDNGTTWHRAMPFDINQTDNPTNSTSVNQNFTITNPFYDIQFNAIRLYPIPTASSTSGLKIWFYRPALEFASTDTTKVPGIDIPFHRMIAIGACLDFAVARNMGAIIPVLQGMWTDYETRLRKFYGSKDVDRRMNLGSNYSTNYGQ